MNAGELVIKTSLDNKDFTIQINEVEKKLNDLEATYEILKGEEPFEGQKKQLEEVATEIEKTKNKLVGFYKQQNKVNEQGFSGMSKSLKSIGKGLTSVVKTVGKWALAIFAVRSIYTGIRQIISQVSQYNKQVATDLDYMKYSIAQALTPVVEYLVKLFYAVLINVREIIQSLTGFNIFANSGAKGFKEANKQAEKMKKTLAGFDEVNVLQDDKDKGTPDPSYDLSKASKIAVTGVGETIDKIKDLVTKVYKSLKDNIEKALEDVGFSKKVIDSVKRMVSGVELVIKGVLDFIGGILDLALGLLTGNGDLVLKGFVRIVDGIGEILWGMLKTQLNLYQTIGLYILDIFIKLFSDIVNKTKEIFEVIKGTFSNLGTFLYNTFKNAWDRIVKLFSKGGQIFNGFKEGVVNTFKTIVNTLITGINIAIQTPFNKLNELLNNIRTISVAGIKPFKNLYGKNPITIPKIPKLARGGIVNNPGAGVMMGSYVAGERGAEAVMPLTDPSSLQMIGEAIGRYITINNVVENYMDSRRINRVLQQSRGNDMLANNGGVI